MMDGTFQGQDSRTELHNRGVFTPFFGALSDISQGLQFWRIWTSLSWQEFRSTYRRSALGILWVTLSFGLFVLVKLVIFSSLLYGERQTLYDMYLLLGFFTWFYISQSVSSSADCFFSNQTWIKSEPLPLTIYVFKAALREFYSFTLTAFVVVAGVIYIGYDVTWIGVGFSLLAIPVFILSSCATKLFLGTIGTRFRDISHLLRAIMLPMMFLTPVFWMPSQMGTLMSYLWWNPFFHYLEIIRAPLLNGAFPIESWIFVGCFLTGLSVFGFAVFASFRQRIVFWF